MDSHTKAKSDVYYHVAIWMIALHSWLPKVILKGMKCLKEEGAKLTYIHTWNKYMDS